MDLVTLALARRAAKSAVEGLNTFSTAVVDSLPTSDIDPHTIYFVPSPEGNGHDEYIYVDGTWEKIGSTAAILDDYIKKEQFDDLITVSEEQPTSTDNKIWIEANGSMTIKIPTMEDFEQLAEKLENQENLDDLRDIVIISDTQPVDKKENKLWVNPSAKDEIELATTQEVNDLILVQDEQPTADINKLWITHNESSIEVPTQEEFDQLANEVKENAEKVEDALENLEEATTKAEEAAEKAEEAASKLDDFNNTIDGVEEALKEISDKNDELVGTVEELSNKTDELSGKADELATKADELSGKVDEMSEALEELEGIPDKVDELSEKIDNLPEQINCEDLILVQEEQPTSEINKLWIKPGDSHEINIPTEEDVKNLLDEKLDINHGTENAGKLLGIDENGNITYLEVKDIQPEIPEPEEFEQVQADWNQKDTNQPDFIKNKPFGVETIEVPLSEIDSTKIDENDAWVVGTDEVIPEINIDGEPINWDNNEIIDGVETATKEIQIGDKVIVIERITNHTQDNIPDENGLAAGETVIEFKDKEDGSTLTAEEVEELINRISVNKEQLQPIDPHLIPVNDTLTIDSDGKLGVVEKEEKVQEQADWNEADHNSVSYIKNKPFYKEQIEKETLVSAENSENETGINNEYPYVTTVTNNVPFEGDSIEVKVGDSEPVQYEIAEVDKDDKDQYADLMKYTVDKIYTFGDDSSDVKGIIIDHTEGNPTEGHEIYIFTKEDAPVEVVVSETDVKTLDPEMLPFGDQFAIDENGNLILSQDAMPQSDWAQNDETKPDYIKNRPFYENSDGTVSKIDTKYLNTTAKDGEDTVLVTNEYLDDYLDEQFDLLSKGVEEYLGQATKDYMTSDDVEDAIKDLATQQFVQEEIAKVPSFTYEILETLPETPSADNEYKVYLVERTDGTMDEYMAIKSGDSYKWELIGSLPEEVDLSGYYTSEQVNNLLAQKASASDVGGLDERIEALEDDTTLSTHMADEVAHVTAEEREVWNNKSDFSGSYNDLTDKPEIPSIEGLAKQSDVTTALGQKADKSELDNKLDASAADDFATKEELKAKADSSELTALAAKVSGLEEKEDKNTEYTQGTGITISENNTISISQTVLDNINKAVEDSSKALSGEISGLTDVTGRVDDVESALQDKASQTDVDNLTTDVSGLQGDMTTAKSDIETLQSDVEAVQGDVSSLQGDMTTAKSDISGLKSDVEGLQGDVSSLQSDTSTLKTDVSGLKTDVSGLQSDMTTAKSDISGLKTDVSGLQTDVSSLQTDMAGVKSDVEGLQSDVSTLQTDVSGLKTDMSGLQSDVSGLKTDVGTLTTDVSGLKTDMTTAQSDISTLQGDVSGIRTEIETLSGNVGQLQTDVSGLQSEFSGMQTTVSGLQTDVGTLQTDVSGLTGRLSTLENKADKDTTYTAGVNIDISDDNVISADFDAQPISDDYIESLFNDSLLDVMNANMSE